MKPNAGEVARLLRAPGACRLILLHGDDTGLIRERAAAVTRAVAGTLDDPFRIAVLGPGAQERFEEEADALSFSGGRRVVWVREAGDALAAPATRVLDRGGDSLLVLEGPGLAGRSALRALAERRSDAASIGCYPEEGRALEATLTQLLAAHGVTIAPEALGLLASRLGADRAAVRAEAEKLALYAGEGGRLDLDAIEQCTGDAGAASLEDAAAAAACGDRAAADRALERTLADGTSPVGVARALLSYLGRLRQARRLVEAGQSEEMAVRALRPPVFFRRVPAFRAALRLWSLPGLEEAARATLALELACKQTGAPDLALCRRHLARIAEEARRHRSAT